MIHQHPVTYAQFGYTVLFCFVIAGVVILAHGLTSIAIHYANRRRKKGK